MDVGSKLDVVIVALGIVGLGIGAVLRAVVLVHRQARRLEAVMQAHDRQCVSRCERRDS